MIEAAYHHARLRKPQKDGHTYGEHLESLVRLGRKPPEILEGPPIPDEIAYLWAWFGELERTRQVGAHGMMGFTYADIDAWARLTDRHLTPYEVEALVALDLAVRFPEDGNG